MNEPVTKTELREILREVFREQDVRLEAKFVTKQEFGNFVDFVTEQFGEVKEILEDMKPSIDLVEKHDLRIENIEKRTTILKTVIEKDLHRTVVW